MPEVVIHQVFRSDVGTQQKRRDFILKEVSRQIMLPRRKPKFVDNNVGSKFTVRHFSPGKIPGGATPREFRRRRNGHSPPSETRGEDDLCGLVGVGLRACRNLGNHLSYYTRGLSYKERTNRDQFAHKFDPDFGETYGMTKGAGDSLLPDRTFYLLEARI
jgi:hypothetical protein